MLQIRKNVFETNSSSSHSLHITRGEAAAAPFSAEVLRTGVYPVTLGDYHWEWGRYYTLAKKLDYMCSAIAAAGKFSECETCDDAREFVPEFRILDDLVREKTGVRITLPSVGHASRGASIDHQSENLPWAVLKDKERLETLLFSEKSYIQTGNDNDSPPVTIATDCGTVHYYQDSYREPSKGWPTLVLTSEGAWYWQAPLVSPGGVTLSDDMKALLTAYATVESIDLTFTSFSEDTSLSEQMAFLREDCDFFFTKELSLTKHQIKADRSTTTKCEGRYVFRMPEHALSAFNALENKIVTGQ